MPLVISDSYQHRLYDQHHKPHHKKCTMDMLCGRHFVERRKQPKIGLIKSGKNDNKNTYKQERNILI